MFDKEIYVRRRAALASRMEGQGGLVMLMGNVEAPAQYRDNCYKWRQDSSWIYFIGLDEPRQAYVMDLDAGTETLFADDYDVDDIIWMGPMPSVASQAEKAGIACSAPYSALDTVIAEALKLGRKVHFLPTSRYYNSMKVASLLGISPEQTVSVGKAGCPAASAALVKAAIEMRLVKEPCEIEQLDAACDLGYGMHVAGRRGIKVGRIEQELVGEMEGTVLSKGWGVSFPTILTQHGETFHCHSHEAPIVPGKLMVIDAGAELGSHYASDFTRTYPTAGKFTAKQRDIYQTVYECNELAFNMVKPGVAYLDCHQAVSRHLLDNLKQLGLVKGSVDDMMVQGVAGLFMPHGLGHNMGLDVHDMEDYGENLVGYDPDQQRSPLLGLGSLRMARRLKPGNVMTDEPGIYFIPALIEDWKAAGKCAEFVNYDKLKEYYDFGGIRLEDDLLVTEDGVRRLGAKRLPIAPDDVEKAMEND